MSKLIVGIDPGLDGAISFLDADTGKIIELHPMPVISTISKNLFETKKVKRKVCPNTLNNILKGHSLSAIIIERVSASPQMGVTSAFSFGEGYGLTVGILKALYPNVPMHFVMPSVWKMRLNVTKDKSLSNQLAAELFPEHAHIFKKKDAGLAESAMVLGP